MLGETLRYRALPEQEETRALQFENLFIASLIVPLPAKQAW
jgi:hypothetical protein